MMAKKPPSVLHLIPSMDQGGAERILASLVAGEGSRGDHIVIALLAGEPFFPVEPEKFFTLGLAQRSPALRPFWRLRRLVAQRRPSVIHAWLYHGTLLPRPPRGLAIPTIWPIHTTRSPPRTRNGQRAPSIASARC